MELFEVKQRSIRLFSKSNRVVRLWKKSKGIGEVVYHAFNTRVLGIHDPPYAA